MKRKICELVFMLVVISASPACASPYPSYYSAEAIEAKVIDADTKKPIDGVIVTANWQLLGGMEGSLPIGQMQVLETQTGSDGVFRFPAWGPLKRPRGYIREDGPQLLLFKPGYEYKRLANEVVSKINYDSVRRSRWNGKTIEMKKFEATTYEPRYEDNFNHFNRELDRIATRDPKACDWKKIPNAIRAMSQERKRLESQGVNPNTLSTIDKDILLNDKYYSEKGDCGSPKEFFGGFKR